MKQVMVVQGQAVVEEVPAPQVEPGTVLVRVENSCISVGTEMSGLTTSSMPLWKRALRQPQNLKKVIDMAKSNGIARTYSFVQGRVGSGNATGYSAAGTVIAVGAGIDDVEVGDRMACAGAQCAHHAEFIRVPRNLAVPIPDNLDMPAASTVTLGAIALQGVRRASPTLGECFVVVGLGVLGQITVQLLKANGCRVIGSDLDKERIAKAISMGCDAGLHPDDGPAADQVARLTDGLGADGVIITAAGTSNEIVAQAFRITRKKGRVVLVGDVGLSLSRADFFEKEIDFFISSSYGPGRYDRRYEEKGLDYPVAFVRWTENRNMGEYLHLLSTKQVKIEPLVAQVFPVDQATEAYRSLQQQTRPLMVLLSYAHDGNVGPTYVVPNPKGAPSSSGRIRLALVGAGGFAKGMHLPNIQALGDKFHLRAVMSRTGHNAVGVAKQFGAAYSTTDYQAVLADPEVDAVIIATRHSLHAEMTLEALKAGKHVLVEKPLALTLQELERIEHYFVEAGGKSRQILLTGFNRRFSVYAKRIHEIIKTRTAPMVMVYKMNAGYIPMNHWVHTEEGGGRNLGEACHIYDLFTFLTGSNVVDVRAAAVKSTNAYYSATDNFTASMTFEDGSIATLIYTAMGSKDYPKERLEVFVDGSVIELDDYKELRITGAKHKGLTTTLNEKGQREELEDLAKAILGGGEWPIPLWQQLQASRIACRVEEQIRRP